MVDDIQPFDGTATTTGEIVDGRRLGDGRRVLSDAINDGSTKELECEVVELTVVALIVLQRYAEGQLAERVKFDASTRYCVVRLAYFVI